VGDRVAYATARNGAYAEVAHQPADRLIFLPDDVSDEIAAAVLLKGMTAAYLLLKTFAVKAGQTILLHAAAGGTGLVMVQWAKALGARVIGTVGSAEKAALAARLGCDHTILYRDQDTVSRVREITGGRGVPVVYDSVGAATYRTSLDCLAPLGMLVSFGNASGPVSQVKPLDLAFKGSLFFTRPTLATHTTTRKSMLELAQALFARLRSGDIKVIIGQKFPMADIRQAHEALEARRTVGSSVLIP